MRFLFHGNWLPDHDRYLEDLKLKDAASIQPPVPYDKYLQMLKQSPVLLLVVSSAHNLLMPSKIVDYFGAARPIMAFVPRDSEMRHVLEQAGMAEFASDELDAEAGASVLGKLWERYQARQLVCDSGKTQFWSSAVQLPKYVDMVANLKRS
jgi:hypothetical protein